MEKQSSKMIATTPPAPAKLSGAGSRQKIRDMHHAHVGPLAGKVWRIGLMGYSSSEENVNRVLAALKELL
jgi:alanine-glyoxylate transaminase/serine-glyoxylate transaminase/serine-pyruvate transaminase